jgi:hypothetical protein
MSVTISSPIEFMQILEALQIGIGELFKKTNRSATVEVDLSTAHSSEPLGIEVSGRKYSWITIERCDDALNYQLRQTDNSLSGLFRASMGRGIIQHEFKDIIVSNPVATLKGSDGRSVCRFVVGWWED